MGQSTAFRALRLPVCCTTLYLSMAMDPELKTVLTTLVDRVDKLAEGQERLVEGQEKLTEQMTRAAALINSLADGQAKLTERVHSLADGQAKLTERVDGFTAVVLRGFTDTAGREHVLDKRVDQLEDRVTKLEHV